MILVMLVVAVVVEDRGIFLATSICVGGRLFMLETDLINFFFVSVSVSSLSSNHLIDCVND